MFSGTAPAVSPLDNAFFAVLKQALRDLLHAAQGSGHSVSSTAVGGIFLQALRACWPTLPAFFAHCGIHGDPNAEMLEPAANLELELRFGQRPAGAPKLGSTRRSSDSGKRKRKTKPRPLPRTRAQRSPRVQSADGTVFRKRSVNPASPLITALVRSMDPVLDGVKRTAKSGVPRLKRDKTIEAQAVAALTTKLGKAAQSFAAAAAAISRKIVVFVDGAAGDERKFPLIELQR